MLVLCVAIHNSAGSSIIIKISAYPNYVSEPSFGECSNAKLTSNKEESKGNCFRRLFDPIF